MISYCSNHQEANYNQKAEFHSYNQRSNKSLHKYLHIEEILLSIPLIILLCAQF